jgi:serine protease Do
MKYLLVIVVSALVALSLVGTRRNPVDAPMTRMLVYPAHYADRYADDAGPADFTEVARAAVQATVHVSAKIRDDWGRPGFSSGSGAILSEDGIIVTNYHVVRGAEGVTVRLGHFHTLKAKVIGSDPETDIAVLKVDAHGLPFFSYGNSDELRIGEWVLAIGYPLGLESTVTAGIVSARSGSFIQTDAAVNLGNSGGPLVDRAGRLIGINAALTTSTGSYVGYSFAIPAQTVKRVVNRLLGMGEPTVSR